MKQLAILEAPAQSAGKRYRWLRLPRALRIVALAAGPHLEELVNRSSAIGRKWVAVADAALADVLRDRLRQSATHHRCPTFNGAPRLVSVATHPDASLLVSAAVESSGLEATYASGPGRKQIALSNKEVLVAAGNW